MWGGGDVPAFKLCSGDGELQRAEAAESGGGGGDPGESEMNGGALVVSRLVTVLAAVLDREV